MKRRRFAALAIGGLAAPLAGAQSAIEGATSIPPIGTPIAIPDVVLLDGERVPGSHWKGKVLVVEAWATWCPFCAKQNPLIDRLHRDRAGQGLEVLALSIDRKPEDALTYVRERGYAFRVAMFDDRWKSAIGRPKQIPALWVIGRDGRLAFFEAREMFPEDVADLARFLRS
jgi:thiol-disulfide isomerase/thioredoxin